MSCLYNCSGSLVSTLELSRKRNQIAKVSSESCVSREVVDGIEPLSANVFSRMDLEHAKFINPNLTWKNVKKGRRSMARRSKKPIATTFRVLVELGNKMQDSSVFESEKLGVAVLGQHFAEKVVNVPIKKRRLPRQSPSPPPRTPSLICEGSLSPQPQTPSPPHEESEHLADSKFDSSRWCGTDPISRRQAIKVNNGVISCKIPEPINKERCYLDDFSGIELLAATACCSIDDSGVRVEESSLVEELATPEGVDFSTAGTKETIASIESDGSSIQDNTIPALQSLHDSENSRGTKRSLPSKDDRLHWDLNTVMDEWEEPCYDPLDDSHRNCYSGIDGDGLQKGSLNMEVCETKDMGHEEGEHKHPSMNSTSTFGMQNGEDCHSTSSMGLGKLLPDSLQIGKDDVATSDVPFPDKYTLGIINCQNENGKACGTLEMPGDGTSSGEVIGTVNCKASDAESSLAAKCEDLSTLTTSILGRQTVVPCDSRGKAGLASTAENNVHDLPVHFEPKKIMPDHEGQLVSEDVARGGLHSQKSCRTDDDNKLGSEDPLSDCCGSNVFQDEQGQILDGDIMPTVQEGYDSPFEDGELREPIVYAWEDNEVDREIECVDYESDSIYEDDLDTAEHTVSDKLERCHEGSQVLEDGTSFVELDATKKLGMVGKRALDAGTSSSIEQCAKRDASKKSSCLVSPTTSGLYQPQEHCEDMILEGNNDSSRKFHPEDRNGHVERSCRGYLLRIEGSSSFRKSNAYIHQNGPVNDGSLYSRDERDVAPEKILERNRVSCQVSSRNEVDTQWVDSIGVWGSRNSYGYPRPRNIVSDLAAKSGGFNSHEHSQSRNYAPQGMYRPLNRRRSPADRNGSYGIHRDTLPMRGFSHDRSRGRSGFYPQGLRRAPQEEYHEPGPCYLERKERCFSPNFNKGAHVFRARRRSRSRSRSRSPIAWHLERERNMVSRRQSPDYRSEARVLGERFPYQKPRFSSDFEGGFVSPTRGRFSIQHSSKGFDEKNRMDGHFRDRRLSPVRMFRRSQRFDSVGHPGSLKSDDYFRPMPRPGRFLHMDNAVRGRRYEDSNDNRRKHDDRYEIVNRGRRYDAGVSVKRFRYEADDVFEGRSSHNDNCFRGVVRRDVPGSIREERGVSKYNETTPSSPGERDCDEDASPKEG